MFAYDYETLELMQRAYNAALLDVFGADGKPEENVCDGIAKAILFMTSAGQRDPAKLASFASSKARILLGQQKLAAFSFLDADPR